MGKITIEQILDNWLLTKTNQSVAYHNVEEELPIFGRAYGIRHNASSYCRVFRKIKERGHKMFDFIKQETNGHSEKWLIKKKWEE